MNGSVPRAARPAWLLFAAAILAAAGIPPLPAAPPPDAAPPADDYAADLPRIPQTPPSAAAATMRVQPGFTLELAVAEPLLASPVAIAWDEDGRMFVAEMRGYSEDQAERLGRIRLLHDDDRDGAFDRATVFAADLAWPTAVVAARGGVFVGDAPDILFLADRDGDGVADERRTVFTGFGTGNVQGLLNSFSIGLDNRVHGAGSSAGGSIRRVDAAGAAAGPAVAIGGRDFSFDPRTLDFRAETGGAQHGRTTDDDGDVYLCHNSDHCIRVMIDDRFLGRNRFFPAPAAKESVAVEGPQAAVFRTSPVEPWRVLRTRLRAAGVVPGIVEGGGRPAGYFTSATGITYVRGDAVGDLAGCLVVGDVGSNLVHRKRLLPHGAGVRAERIDAGGELVASTDIWFRPVQFACGPDGALWIVDMQREVIEHPASLAPPIKRHLDLTSGRDTGRLWRLFAAVPAGSAPAARRPPPRLSTAGTADLVALLAHPNGWHRDTAQRLLVERADQAATPLLRRLAADPGAPPRAQLHAAHSLAGLGGLHPEDLVALLAAKDTAVRGAAVRLAEPFLSTAAGSPAEAADGGAGAAPVSTARSKPLSTALERLAAGEPAVAVRFPLAMVAGGMPDGPRREIVRTLLARDGVDPWCRFACFTSLAGDAGAILEEWLATPERLAEPGPAAALPGLVVQVGRRRDPGELARLVAAIDRLTAAPVPGAADTRPLAADLLAGLAAAGVAIDSIEPVAITRDLVARLDGHGLARAVDRGGAVADRGRALERLVAVRPADLAPILVPDERPEVVRAAIAAIDRSRDATAAPLLAKSLGSLPPEARPAAVAALVSSAARARLLLDAVAAGTIAAADIDRQSADRLWTFPDEGVRSRAAEVLGPPPAADRGPLVAAYAASLPPHGDAAAGRTIFRRHCAACHRVEGEGRETGPALAAVQARGAEALLLGILDPNREVLPAWLAHAAQTDDGRVVTGIVVAQSPGSVTLRTAEGTDVTLPRDDLESLTDTRRSLMPEGFERAIDPRGMADLLAYLLSAR